MLQKQNIVVFDFDGTLSARDSSVEFGKYCLKKSYKSFVYLPILFIALVGRMLNPAALWWRETMRFFITPQMIKDLAPSFIKQHRNQRFNWAKRQVAKERANGNKVVLVSAGVDYLVPHLVSDIKFDAVLTSRMNKQSPWKYDFLCWGKNKVVALDKWAMENKIIPNVVRSYSDSKSDMPMMEIAKEQVWIDRKTGSKI